MLINVRTHGLEATDAIVQQARQHIVSVLGRVSERVTGVTVRFDDINGDHGGEDKQCRIMASFRSMGTIIVEAVHRDLYAALGHAAHRLVTMNSRVRVRGMRANSAETYTLVYPRDANIDAGKLSVLAPLGTAILGGRTGDVIRWQLPAGIRTLKIERVLYQPQATSECVVLQRQFSSRN